MVSDRKDVNDSMARAQKRLFTLRPLVLESQGLTAALRQLAEKVHETHGQVVIVEAENDHQISASSEILKKNGSDKIDDVRREWLTRSPEEQLRRNGLHAGTDRRPSRHRRESISIARIAADCDRPSIERARAVPICATPESPAWRRSPVLHR